MHTVPQTATNVDQLDLQKVFDALITIPLGSCDSLPHATRIGDNMRSQLPLILSGKQACFEGQVGPHLCAENDRPFSCAHRVDGNTGGFDPEIGQLERLGVPIPENLIIQNERFRKLVGKRDGMAHRIGGLAADKSIVENHKMATEAAAVAARELHGALIDLIRRYFVNK